MDGECVLITGGSGLLGLALQRLLPGAVAPSSADFDVRNLEQMARALPAKVEVVVHAAAVTSPPTVEQDPEAALSTNIVGTANVAALCARRGLRLVYISTDYVFRGDEGNYGEDDAVHPVNKYAWSKLGGECAVRLHENALIVRTTFGPNEFPYPKAFTDQWTSRECVSKIAALLKPAILSDAIGVLHVGGPRKTVHDYAQALSPEKEIGPLRTDEVNFPVPRDTSLDTTRYQQLFPREDVQ